MRVSVLVRDLFDFYTVKGSFFEGLIRTISKFYCTIASLPVVIPAQAGIYVFQSFKWTPAFARVTPLLEISLLR